MGVSAQVRRCVFELADNCAPMAVDAVGVVDEADLFECVRGRLQSEHTPLWQLLVAEATEVVLRSLIAEWERKSQSEYAEQSREASGIEKRAQRMRDLLKVPDPDSDTGWTTKRRMDLTRIDLERMIPHRESLLKAEAREVAWMKRQLRKMVQLALPATATVRDVLDVAA